MKSHTLVAVLSFTFTIASCGLEIGHDSIDNSTSADEDTPSRTAPTGGATVDTIAPSDVTDLVATEVSHAAVKLTWTAPGDDGDIGKAASYEVRYSKTPITTDAEFSAATAATGLRAPAFAGTAESATIGKLDPETTYYFGLRTYDKARNVSAIALSNVVTTKARAKMIITEVSPANPSKADFVELVVTKAGWAGDLEITQANSSLHRFSGFDVAAGDYIVVHASGLPGPAGFQQEDEVHSKTASTALGAASSAEAFDVYSSQTKITGTDNVVSLMDGAAPLDAVAFSQRSGVASAAAMAAFATARSNGMWNFSVAPIRGVNDCETQAEAVAVSTVNAATCGRFATGITAGISINRQEQVDTNSRADFYLAEETPGAVNTPVAAPRLKGVTTTSATQLELSFDQEIAPSTISAQAFTIPAPTITAATRTGPNRVLLTASAPISGPLVVTVSSSVTNLQGVSARQTASLCAGVDPALTISEVNPNLPGGADLIELAVTRGGPLERFEVRANPTAAGATGTLLATLPAICAAAGDVVVVHLNPAAAPGAAPASETTSMMQYAHIANAANYDSAWDVLGGKTDLSTKSNVVALRNPAGAYVEAVAFTDATATSLAFQSSLAFIQSQGLWAPANCGGAACTDTSTPKASDISANWAGCATTTAGESVYRTAAGNTASRWVVGPSSFGRSN
ncbi:MAG: hypothetical protein FWD69_01850 [Polyangiaceae bacterium]|nr:hypothetical protein [Polyangiaceae bacterium]